VSEQEPPDETEDDNPVADFQMPLMEHLRELRTRLIIAIVSVVTCMCLAFLVAPHIWSFLSTPMTDAIEAQGHGMMAITSPVEGIVTYLRVAFIAGLFLAAPIVFYQFWSFVAPGLYPKEQKIVLPLVFASTTLFLLGAAFGYAVIFRYAFPFFLAIVEGHAESVISISAYLSTATRMLFAFGLCFQLPVIAFFLARIGMIDAKDMRQGFKYAIVGMFVVSAMITPPDVMTQILMAGPLISLYGIGMLVAKLTSTKQRNEDD